MASQGSSTSSSVAADQIGMPSVPSESRRGGMHTVHTTKTHVAEKTLTIYETGVLAPNNSGNILASACDLLDLIELSNLGDACGRLR